MAPADKTDGAEEPDWAEIYADLLCHTSLSYEAIGSMTIPQIEAIRIRLGKHIPIQFGIPGIFGGVLDNSPSASSPTGKPPKLSEIAAFCSAFDGVSG